MDASDTYDRRLWNSLRVLLYGVAALVGTLGVAVGVLSLVAVLPSGLPLFLVFLFVGILAIVATPSVVVVAWGALRPSRELIHTRRRWSGARLYELAEQRLEPAATGGSVRTSAYSPHSSAESSIKFSIR